MNPYPAPIRNLVKLMSRLPGIGEKSAMRLVMHMLDMPAEQVEELGRRIAEINSRIQLCSVCCNITESQPCEICASPRRDRSIVCVVETPGDLMAVEASGGYTGVYHVLHGVLSPVDGVGPDKLRVRELLDRAASGEIREVIVATNPTAQGEATASYLMDRLKDLEIAVSRIGFGVPVGGDLKFSDALSLRRSLEGRHRISH